MGFRCKTEGQIVMTSERDLSGANAAREHTPAAELRELLQRVLQALTPRLAHGLAPRARVGRHEPESYALLQALVALLLALDINYNQV